ncbi:hypothetical protein EDF22_0625 [Rathayibacter sp. PhB127]|jgi:hypothetical protein|nr:hypothetical protein EDF22_0625 [Rathayibacter sp. PhB127]
MICPDCGATFPVRSLYLDHKRDQHEQETT